MDICKRLLIAGLCLLNLWIGVLFLLPLRSRPLWDLPQFYFAGQFVRSGRISQLYNKPAYEPLIADLRKTNERAAQRSLYFNRPVFEAPLFLPLAFLSFRSASVLVFTANLALIVVLVWNLPKWFPSGTYNRIWLFIFLPFLYSVALGQDTLLLTLLVGYGLHLAHDRRDLRAGAFVALAAFKPHLILLIPLALAAAKRWKMLSAFLATGAVLALFCFATLGAQGIHAWIALLQAPTTDTVPLLMGNARALGLHFGAGAGISAEFAAVISFGIVLRNGSFAEKFVAALLAGVLLGPHIYLQDYSLLAVAALAALPAISRYCVLLPWPYFYPTLGKDMIPLIVVALACLVSLAAKPFAQHFMATSTKLNPFSRSSQTDIPVSPGKG